MSLSEKNAHAWDHSPVPSATFKEPQGAPLAPATGAQHPAAAYISGVTEWEAS